MGTYVHMCTKYEVSMSNPVPGRGVHRCQHQHRHQRRMMTHDGQSMTVQGPLVDKPNEPKTLAYAYCTRKPILLNVKCECF